MHADYTEADPISSNAFSEANTPESPPRDIKPADSDISTASPPIFHFIFAPRQSKPVLSFLGARTPLTIFSGQNHGPTASRIRPAEPEPLVHFTLPIPFVLPSQPAPADPSSPPLTKVVGPDPDNSPKLPNAFQTKEQHRRDAGRRSPPASRKHANAQSVQRASLHIAAQRSLRSSTTRSPSRFTTQPARGLRILQRVTTRTKDHQRVQRRYTQPRATHQCQSIPNAANLKARTRMPRSWLE